MFEAARLSVAVIADRGRCDQRLSKCARLDRIRDAGETSLTLADDRLLPLREKGVNVELRAKLALLERCAQARVQQLEPQNFVDHLFV